MQNKPRFLLALFIALLTRTGLAEEPTLEDSLDQLRVLSEHYFKLCAEVNTFESYTSFLNTQASLMHFARDYASIDSAQARCFDLAQKQDSVNAYKAFLKACEAAPDYAQRHDLKPKAVARIFDTVKAADLAEGYLDFLKTFSTAPPEYIAEINQRLCRYAFRNAQKDDTVDAFVAFLVDCPTAPEDLRKAAIERCVSLKVKELSQSVPSATSELERSGQTLVDQCLDINERLSANEPGLDSDAKTSLEYKYLINALLIRDQAGMFSKTEVRRQFRQREELLRRFSDIERSLRRIELLSEDIRSKLVLGFRQSEDRSATLLRLMELQSKEIKKLTEFPLYWDRNASAWENVKANGQQALNVCLEKALGKILP